uniref:Uncharacterized protein n=1 Tax=Thermogemmatispora argillosa TaxID=2045280 RepID=A0A455T6K5_9CHLR|nr:hypothetical protein KTA_27140 [Thermogemmatispora argillosa]
MGPFARKALGGGAPNASTCSGDDSDTIFNAHVRNYSKGDGAFSCSLSPVMAGVPSGGCRAATRGFDSNQARGAQCS